MGYKVYNVYGLTVIATTGALMFGFDVSSLSAFVDQEAYLAYFKHPNSITQGGITASMTGGSFLSAFFAGYLMDWLGRRPVMQVAGLFWILGCAIQSSAQNVAQLISGRLIAGCGIGFVSAATPVYIAEIAPKHIRGSLGALFQWTLTWGIMIMFYIGYGCSFIEGTASFRTAWGLMATPSLSLILGSVFIPESPRWLATQGRWDEAIHIVSMVHANGDTDHPEVQLEVRDMQIALENEMNKKIGLLDLFRKENISRTMVGIFAKIWQQLTGMNVMMYYIVYMFQMAGFQGNNLLVSASIQYVINMVMTVPAILYVDKIGRRKALISGSTCMFICLLCTVCLLAVYSSPLHDISKQEMIRITVKNTKASKAIISFSFLFVASFASTWGPVIWIYCSEIFPTSQRGHANGLSTGINWLFNFALAFFVPTALKNITWRTYVIFMLFNLVMIVHVYLCFPETKRKTLEEITAMWDENVPAWRTAACNASIDTVTKEWDENGMSDKENMDWEDITSEVGPV